MQCWVHKRIIDETLAGNQIHEHYQYRTVEVSFSNNQQNWLLHHPSRNTAAMNNFLQNSTFH